MEIMKYKVGDKVRIKSLDWYNENKDEDGIVELSTHLFIPEMVEHCGTVVTIKDVFEDIDDNVVYDMKEIDWDWTNEMIEGLVEDETKTLTTEKMDKVIEEAKTYWDSIKDAWICPEGYQFVDENGNIINAQKIVLEKKKKEYPKTYEECAEIIAELTGSDCNPKGCMGYMSVQLTALQKLLTCRDAYWKIAGEEMGLDKPWKPDWNTDVRKYCIGVLANRVQRCDDCIAQYTFAFPTAEMRDAFYENFKSEIESCKELL